ncbi:MAG TPA: cell envelope integrity protein TolA [Verrucomicrobiae bacterium]|nr:cell envelope integrity protein TolA [Verrucomicrobiae bacterium]
MFREEARSFGRELVSGSITRALAISLLLHFAGIAGVELGRNLGWWRHSLLPTWVQKDLLATVAKTAAERAELQKQLLQQRPPPEAELVFIDIDPSQATPEPPKGAKYYSSHNTVAANREKDLKLLPKIEGKQEKVPKTTDTLRPDPKALQPSPPEKQPSKMEVMKPAPEQPKPAEPKGPRAEPQRESEAKGETLLARVTPRDETTKAQRPPDNPTPAQPPRKRPASVAEAKAQKGILDGPKMRQSGGIGRIAPEGMDVKATPFGSYDALFIAAVQARWFSLLDERDFAGAQSGKVLVEFRLHQDGRITNLSVINSDVSEILSWFCQRAILDPSPYRPFPTDLRREMDRDYREIRFTFYYNQ